MRGRAGLQVALSFSVALGCIGAAPAVVAAQPASIDWSIQTKGRSFDSSPYFTGLAQGADGTVVMVGIVRDRKGRPTAAAWRSADARTWVRTDWVTPKRSGAAGVVATPTGFVAIGGGGTWTSADGTDWMQHPQPGGAFNDIVVSPGGLVAVGQVDAGPAGIPTLWTSTDGLAWVPLTLGDVGRPVGVAAAPDGTLVVAGNLAGADGTPMPAVWLVRDGVVSSASLDGLTPAPSGVIDLRWTPIGFVLAVIHNDDGVQGASVWVSADGSAWSRPLDVHDGGITTLGTLGPSVLAFGTDRMWQTSDGVTWQETPVPAFKGYGISTDIELADGRLLAAGARYTGPDTSRPATFLGHVPAPPIEGTAEPTGAP
jgi:hypothetical protein